MAFERFVKTTRSFTPKVSIWGRGQIGFNTGAVHKFGLEKFDYAILFFDKETRRIGIVFTNDEKEKGVVRLTKRMAGMSLSAKPFLEYYDVLKPEKVVCDFRFSNEDNMYIIEIPGETLNQHVDE